MNGYRLLALISFLLILIGCFIGIIVPAGPGWDFANFYDAGRRIASGQLSDLYNPERPIAGEKPQGKLAFYGAPVSAFLYVPLSLFEPETALVLFKVQNTFAYFLALSILYFHFRDFASHNQEHRQQFLALFLFLALIFQPFWTIYRVGGQTTPTAFLLFSLGLIFHKSSRFVLSATVMILAAIIKPAFAIALLFLMAVSPLIFLRNVILLSFGVGILSVVALGMEIHFQFLDQLRKGLQETHSWFYNSSLYVPFQNLKILWKDESYNNRRLILTVLQFTLKLVVVTVTTRLILKSRMHDWTIPAKNHFRFQVSILFFLLISQIIWEHYLAVLFLFLIYMIAMRRHLQSYTVWMVAAIFLSAIPQNMIFTLFLRDHFVFDSAIEVLLIGFFKSVPLYLTLILLLIRSTEFLNTYTIWSKEAANYG